MKKLFALSCAALALAACTSEEENSLVGGDSSKQVSNLTQVSEITRSVGPGSMGVSPAGQKAGNDLSEVYVVKSQDVVSNNITREDLRLVDKTISTAYVNVICNKGTGFFHGENGWAVKNEAAGSLDNNRKTYSYFYNEQGEKQSLEPNDQGLLLTGSNCDLSAFNQNGKRAIVNVGDEWFDKNFAMAENFIAKAFETEGVVRNYGGQNAGEVDDLTYTEYTYQGYTVIKVEQSAFANGGVAGYNGNKAPWCVGNQNSFPTDGDQTTVDHKVIIVPTGDITFDGRNMDCHIFAPGKKVTLLNGACPSGLVICDELKTSSEIHGNWSPVFEDEKPGDKPEPGPCETDFLIDLDFDSDLIVIADDFAIQNGDKLYMNAAIPGEEHVGVTNGNGEGAYVFVQKDNKVQVSVKKICELYDSYIGKYDENQVPFINASGELTLVVYLWPGELNGDQFKSVNIGEQSYIIGEENEPEQHAVNNEEFRILVSAYKGFQGRGEKLDGTEDREGWSYVKVSIHIAKRAQVELPVAAN